MLMDDRMWHTAQQHTFRGQRSSSYFIEGRARPPIYRNIGEAIAPLPPPMSNLHDSGLGSKNGSLYTPMAHVIIIN